MNGQTVALLADQVYHYGSHQAQWREAAQKSGWYVINVIKENQVFTQSSIQQKGASIRLRTH